MDCITVYLYLYHFRNITRDEERQRLKTFTVNFYRYQASMAYQRVHT